MATNRYKYFISAPIFGTREVFPFGEGDAEISYQPKEDGFARDFKREFPQKLTLIGSDFEFLYSIETSVYRCDDVSISIEKNCGGAWSEFLSGKINLASCEWNPGQCIVEIKILVLDDYSDWEQKKDADYDLFPLVPDRQILEFTFPDATLEYYEATSAAFTEPFEYWDQAGTPASKGWVLWKHTFIRSGVGGSVTTNTTFWVREKRTIDCSVELGSPWKFLSQTCPGTRIYSRSAIVYGEENVEEYGGDNRLNNWSRTWKVFGRAGDGVSSIDNGMKLNDVLSNWFSTKCSLTVVSDFFQINPTVATSVNYVTGQISKVLNLLVFQKSDVKRPNSNSNATQCIVNFQQFFESISLFFNLEYRIEGSTIRIEHCSYFSALPGINLTSPQYRKLNRFKTRYSYDTSKLPNKETFLISEKTPLSDFEGTPILYTNNCSQTGADASKEYSVQGMTTDLFYVLNNPESDSKNVSDQGVFLVATDFFAGGNYLITEDGILYLGKVYPNNSLAWSQLLRDYHRYKRPFRNGRMNNTLTTFDSVVPSVKGEEITIPLCCGDVFNPTALITSEIGDGPLESASFSLRTGLLKLNILYEADDESATNQPPIANNDFVTIQMNNSIDVDVLANDSDANGIGTIALVEIVTPPVNGTASIVAKKIRYNPTTGYIGPDSLTYRIRDNALQYSNIAVVAITVADPAPAAINDAFTVKRNQANTIAAPGVLVNDSAGAGSSISVVAGVVVSNLGINITMNANGSFVYNAPNIVGTDFFTYQVVNNLGVTDSATVNLNIINVPSSQTYNLSYSMTDGPQACANYLFPSGQSPYFSTSLPLIVGSVLYVDDLLTTVVANGYYSNGTSVFETNAGVIVNITMC